MADLDHHGKAQVMLGIAIPKQDGEELSPDEADKKGKQAMAEFLKAVHGNDADAAWASFQAADMLAEKCRGYDEDEDEGGDGDDEEGEESGQSE